MFKKLILVEVITVFMLLFGVAAFAEEDEELGFFALEEELMQTVSIATGAKQTVAKAPAVTSVITARDIEAMGATDLDQVLESVPGLHVARNNFDNPVYTIRGIYSSFNYEILVLINGIVL